MYKFKCERVDLVSHVRQGCWLPSLFPGYFIVSFSWKRLLCRVPEGRTQAQYGGAGRAVPIPSGSVPMKDKFVESTNISVCG